ncbi:MAG: hypothetical protein MJB12_00925, partial [Firmicutes bacterium]|nr:hypothetical protein [Bacillota bacterium]
MAINIPLGGTTFDRVKVTAVEDDDGDGLAEGYLLFDRLMISNYCMLENYPVLDPDLPWILNPVAFDMQKPCQCETEESGLKEALTPVLGTFLGYSTAGYNIMCCPVEQGNMEWFRDGNKDQLIQSFVDNKWYVSDVKHLPRAKFEDHLGWFRTGIVPNGYYYLCVTIFSDITGENGYAVPWDALWLNHVIKDSEEGVIQHEQPASTLTVSSNHKGQPYRTAYHTAIKVPWAGDATGLPFELNHYYSSNNCLKAKPFFNGWNCSFEYTLIEDTRFNYEYYMGQGKRKPYRDRDNLGYGLGFGFVSIKKPDGSGQLFRRIDGDSSGGEAIYYPYPDNGSNDRLIRKTFITLNGGEYYLAKVAYTVITGDGREYYFEDEATGSVLLPPGPGIVDWRSEARIKTIKDRFANTINIDWVYSFGDYRIDSASIGSGATERKIQFYDGSDDPYEPYSQPADGFIDKACLIVGGDEDN